MEWLHCNNPERGFLITEIEEPRVDGVPKLTARIVGSYRVVDETTVHARLFDSSEKSIMHDVFPDVVAAQYFILKFVLSLAKTPAQIAT
ncbi:hypothetical protein [Runella sp.]|uniref:hypothetical protein n=1 Tax=Runella sp. TaxID=1960881 RepID=UPI003D0A943E